MKKIISTLFSLVFAIGLFAQQAPPQGINYQAVVYSSTGNQQVGVNSAGQQLLNSHPVKVTFSITAGNLGQEVYKEEHDGIDTDEYGMVNVIIGQGTQLSSSAFNQINWSSGDMYLGVNIYVYEDLPVQSDTITSYQKLWSVPYALYADQANYATNSGHADSSDYAAQAGNGITEVSDNGDGTLTFNYLDGSSYTTGPLTGLGSVGPQGPVGQNGTNGQSAYDLWLTQGNTGTQQDFLNSLQGAQGATGPQGPIGLTGAAGANGKNTLAKTTTETAGANCTTGGVKIEYGLDANNNGTLDVSEINATLTKYVCNGAQGTAGSQNAWSLTGNSGTNPTTNFIGTTDAQDWVIKTNNTERMRVTSAGNVGIGTSTPNYSLLGNTTHLGQIITNTNGSAALQLESYRNAGNHSKIAAFNYRGTSVTPQNLQDGDELLQIGGYGYNGPNDAFYGLGCRIIFGVDGTPSLNSTPGFLEFRTRKLGDASDLSRMFINSDGNVGIGTQTPTGTLHAVNTNGSLRLSGTGATWVTRGVGTPFVVVNQDNDNTQNLGQIQLGRGTGLGENAYITTTGNGTNGVSGVGIGFETPGMRFKVNYDGKVAIGTNTPDALLSVNGSASKAGGGSWATFSDKRVKHDINQFNDGLDVLMKLNPVTFKYNEKSGYTDVNKTFVGFIAQDVEQVAPYMVNIYDDSNGPSGLSDKRQFDESALNKILVNAVQEQQAQIELLKKELEEIKTAFKELKKN